MQFDFLIRGVNKSVSEGTLTEDEAMAVSNRKGMISACIPAGSEVPSLHLTGRQTPPNFIVVRCDLAPAEVEQFSAPWTPDVQTSWQSLNVNADRWRCVVISRLVRARDSHGGMNRGRSKVFLDRWGVTNQDYLANRARGRVTIFQMASSSGFWGRLTNEAFSELSYDQVSGDHVVRMDYRGGRPDRHERAKARVESQATFVAQNEAANTIDFMVTRDDIQAAFEADVERRMERKIAMRRWRLSGAEVDRIIAAGGYDEMTSAAFNQAMEDLTNA